MCRVNIGQFRLTPGHLIGQLRFNFLSSSKLKENLTELHIIVRTTGFNSILNST